MKRRSIRFASALAAALLTLSVAAPVFAQQSNTPKEEVAYVNLSEDGAVQGAYIVNVFDVKTRETVVDYGKYDAVKNLTTTEPIRQEGDLISIDANTGKLYYQGNMDCVTLPWLIGIRYFLDGVEYTAQDLAGKSGELKIALSLKKNPAGKLEFFENYALQATIVLNNQKSENIVAEGATIANVGKNKQITFTVLPGEEEEANVSAQVSDFEMDGIAINAMPLSLNLDVPDTQEYTDKVRDLQDGIAKLDDGAGDLDNGVKKLNTGISDLLSGSDVMQNGLDELLEKTPDLVDGSAKIKDGILQIQNSLKGFAATSSSLNDLVNGSAAMKTGIADLVTAIGQLQNGFDTYDAGLAAAGLNRTVLTGNNVNTIAALNAQLASPSSLLPGQAELYGQIIALLTANSGLLNADGNLITQIDNGVDGVANGASLLKNNYALLDAGIQSLPSKIGQMMFGLYALTDAVNKLATSYSEFDTGLSEYTTAFVKIAEGYSDLYDGIVKAKNGVTDLKNGMSKLTDGTNELCDKTSDMDAQIVENIDDMKAKIPSSDFKMISFVSEKNTNVRSVMFVMKTGEIKKAQIEQETEPKKQNLNFFDKLIKLFRGL